MPPMTGSAAGAVRAVSTDAGPSFLKGHGTENDFVVLLDPDGRHGLTSRQVRALCDRHRGLGADGVLRAVPAEGGAGWFMDYRNADGSIAEMCGNGARLFALALREAELVTADRFTIQTRGGERPVAIEGQGVSVGMGAATTSSEPVAVGVGTSQWSATPVWVPNPHAVVFVDDLADAGDLNRAPEVSPASAFADGVNVEFVVARGPAQVAMRVYERGVGETRSCGTGAVAAAWAWRRRSGLETASVRVDVPGGTVHVEERPDGELILRGPAVIVGRGVVDGRWWKENQ
jgi:diaminopimelate epimerase